MQGLKAEVRDFWNENPCGGYDIYQSRLSWLKERESYAFEILNRDLVEGKRCLDVGCGQGFLANHIANWAKEVIGVDISDNSIRIALEGKKELNRKNLHCFVGDAEALGLRENSFDIIYSMGVLHHIPNTQRGIDEIYQLLKPEGKAIVMLYRRNSPKGLTVCLVRRISLFIDKILNKKYFFIENATSCFKKTKKIMARP
jgi:ubiquinone/menaquinone biosynthesis C-methylase UbiE